MDEARKDELQAEMETRNEVERLLAHVIVGHLVVVAEEMSIAISELDSAFGQDERVRELFEILSEFVMGDIPKINDILLSLPGTPTREEAEQLAEELRIMDRLQASHGSILPFDDKEILH